MRYPASMKIGDVATLVLSAVGLGHTSAHMLARQTQFANTSSNPSLAAPSQAQAQSHTSVVLPSTITSAPLHPSSTNTPCAGVQGTCWACSCMISMVGLNSWWTSSYNLTVGMQYLAAIVNTTRALASKLTFCKLLLSQRTSNTTTRSSQPIALRITLKTPRVSMAPTAQATQLMYCLDFRRHFLTGSRRIHIG